MVKAPQGLCRIAGGACETIAGGARWTTTTQTQHPPPHTTTHQELAVLWTGGAAYTAPHEDEEALHVATRVVMSKYHRVALKILM